MNKLWLYAALSRLPLLSYRSKVIGCAAIAATFPAVAMLSLSGAPDAARLPVLGAALICAAATLAVLGHLLRPISMAAEALRDYAADRAGGQLPTGFPDEAGQMMSDVQKLTDRLDTVRHRLDARHPVTGLQTREPFIANLNIDIEEGVPTGVLGVVRFADYDRLAAFDHDGAERTLGAFAERLVAALGPDRPLAQVDRDAFAIWFSGLEGAQTAAAELRALAHVMSQDIGEGLLKMTPNVGLGAAIMPHDGGDGSILLTRAFAAIPKAGVPGAGKLAFFSAESSAAARDRFALEQALRQAISREQFLLHYQPVVDLVQGKVVGAEALIRWRCPERGLVPPNAFIPILEQTGMMDEVGLWVLNTACREARAWEDQGIGGLKMAVNLSARQFRDPSLKSIIVGTLERHGLEPDRLELELTETATMEDALRTRHLFGELREMGVGVAIDDFGTGYSSLSYLKKLPFSKLKIDREFVERIHERRDSQAICTALVELARGLDITVMAEGVETREEADTLRALGCSTFQGFYFARPLGAHAFVATVTDPAWLALLASPVHREIADLTKRISA